MYIPIKYPKWKYHRSLNAVIVQDPSAEAELGPGWADSPAALAEPEPEPEPPAASEPAPAPAKRKKAK